MPTRDSLPYLVRGIADQPAIVLREDDWDRDVSTLVEALIHVGSRPRRVPHRNHTAQVVESPEARVDPDQPRSSEEPAAHTLLFVGHTIDRTNRISPRFPARFENVARSAIRQALELEARMNGELHGIASASDGGGGDILFHEVCLELGIATTIHLPMPPAQFAAAVAGAGPEWVGRFNRLIEVRPWVINRAQAGVGGVQAREESAAYLPQRSVVRERAGDVRDRDETRTRPHVGDRAVERRVGRAGGPSDVVERSTERGIRVVVLDTRQLFGLEGTPPPSDSPS